MNSTNEIIDALNDVYGKDTFKFTWAIEKNPMRLIDKIIIRVSYKNNILFQTENLIKGEISSEEVLEPIIKEFNKQLMLNILFSIKTDGKIIDPNTGLPAKNLDGSSVKLLTQDSSMRFSAGAGVTWYTPIGPISLSYAVPIGDKEGDETEKVQFQIGNTF